MKENPPVLGADIICMTKAEFGSKRLANQHIAGQASNQGVTMSGERLEYGNEYQDSYPDHWPETKQRLENTEESQFHFNDLLDGNMGNQKLMGLMGQNALENALKGWLSTHNDIRDWGHEPRPLWEDIQKKPEDWSTGRMQNLRQTMEDLFDYTRYEDPDAPGKTLDWLSKRSRYQNAHHAHHAYASPSGPSSSAPIHASHSAPPRRQAPGQTPAGGPAHPGAKSSMPPPRQPRPAAPATNRHTGTLPT